MKGISKLVIAAGIAGSLGMLAQPADAYWWGGPWHGYRSGPLSVCYGRVMTPGRIHTCLRQQWRYGGYPRWGGYGYSPRGFWY